MVERLGEEWVSSWWKGLPGAYNPTGTCCASWFASKGHSERLRLNLQSDNIFKC